MANTVRWDVVKKGLERARHRIIWRPYGFPEIVDPSHSIFHEGEIQQKWDIPDKIIICAAVSGGFFTTRANPNQPVAPAHIRQEALDCLRAGASSIHIHARDARGYSTLSVKLFEEIIDPIRDEFPDVSVDGCLVTAVDGEWEEMQRTLDMRLLDGVPINPTAVFNGDALLAKPVPLLLEKTRLVQEAGLKPIIAVYTDADVNNADRYLFRSGMLESPSYWNILPALPGASPMENPRQMTEGLMRMVGLIRDVDPAAVIMVCAAGRASSYLFTLAATMGLHIRVGMEDTVWRWPHKDEKLTSNLQAFEMAKTMAGVLGREVATPAETRQMLGLPAVAPRRALQPAKARTLQTA